MKVLHVTECVGGGVCNAIDAIVEATPGVDHHLLSVEPSAQGTEPANFRSVHRLPSGHMARVRATHSLVRDLRPDLVHAHSSWAGAYTRAFAMTAPVVYQPHGFSFEMAGRLRKMAYFVAEALLARRTSSVAVLSPHEQHLASTLSRQWTQVLIPNVASIATLGAPSPDRDRSVIMVGRLSPQKDPDFFARLKESTCAIDPSVEFVWVGDGNSSDRSALEGAGVRVTGWLEKPELSQVLATAGVYVHTARYEGFPLSVLDAAVSNLGVLARAIPAFDGSPIEQVAGIDELAKRIVLCLNTTSVMNKLRENNVSLLASMNKAHQHTQLMRLYGTVGKVTR